MRKRSTVIAGKHETSISIEDEFWLELKSIAKSQKISINQLITNIDETNTGNLSSAIRVYVLKNLQKNN